MAGLTRRLSPSGWQGRRRGLSTTTSRFADLTGLENFSCIPSLSSAGCGRFSGTPLLPGDPSIPISLQAVFQRTYDAGPYHLAVEYREDQIDPPLTPAEATWVSQFLRPSNRSEAKPVMQAELIRPCLDQSPSGMETDAGEVACNKPEAQAKGIERYAFSNALRLHFRLVSPVPAHSDGKSGSTGR